MTGLAYVIGDAAGATDSVLAEVAATLEAAGWALSGVVQINTELPGTTRCAMDLQVLGGDRVVRISQALGPHATGCRLDPDGLETAVGLVTASMAGTPGGAVAPGPRLLIVNKFGKAEIEGRGFRLLIAEALGQGIPVLLGLKRDNLAGFAAFADGEGQPLPADPHAVLDWCAAQITTAGA